MLELFAQLLLTGVVAGGSYALLAVGYTLVYGVLGFINFAHQLFATIGAINAEGVTVLMVEQNARRALAHRAYVLELGQNRFEGPGPALLTDPRVQRLYLGRG